MNLSSLRSFEYLLSHPFIYAVFYEIVVLCVGNTVLGVSFDLMLGRMGMTLTEMSGKEIPGRIKNTRAHSNLVYQTGACICIL